jgi:hypothetical protein
VTKGGVNLFALAQPIREIGDASAEVFIGLNCLAAAPPLWPVPPERWRWDAAARARVTR